MNVRKALICAGCASTITLMSTGAAMAGEITGNGESLEPLHANSICAYSGLNDELTPMEPTQTQSYGTFVVLAGKTMFDGDMRAGKHFIDTVFAAPGVACKPGGEH